MIFKAIKIGVYIGLGIWSAINTCIFVDGVAKYLIKKFMAAVDKKSEEKKPEEKKGDTFTYKDDK